MRTSDSNPVSHRKAERRCRQCNVDNQAACVLCYTTQDPSLRWVGCSWCWGRGGRRAETEARRRGLEPCQGKLREKGCQGKPHPPECLQALGHSRARGTSGNVRQNASFHLLLWKDTYTGLLQAWESQDSSHPWGGRSRELFTPCLTGHRHQPCP